MHTILLDLEGGDEVKGKSMLERAVPGAVKAVQAMPDCKFIGLGNAEKAKRILEETVSEAFDRERLAFDDVKIDASPDYNQRLTEAIVQRAAQHLNGTAEGFGEAHGFHTCGNNQHLLHAIYNATRLGQLSKIKGVRPFLVMKMPSRLPLKKHYILCDVGSTVTADERTYEQIVQIARIYAPVLLEGVETPEIGILTNGVEKDKGTPVEQAVREKTGARFVEPQHLYDCSIQLEGRTIPVHGAAIDGKNGNVILKVSEALYKAVIEAMTYIHKGRATPEEFNNFMITVAMVNEWFHPKKQGDAFFAGYEKILGKQHGEAGIDDYAHGAVSVAKAAKAGISEKIKKMFAA